MKIIGRLFFAICLASAAFCSVSANDTIWNHPVKNAENAPAVRRITTMLDSYHVLRSDFVQSRAMSLLKNPLITYGKLIYAKEYGLYWQLLKPYESIYLITREGIYEVDKESGKAVTAAGGDKVFRYMGLMLSAMLTADIRVLEKNFSVYFQEEESEWVVGLKASDGIVKNIIDRILIRGKKHVSQIKIYEKTGDELTIDFHNISNTPNELTESELIYFAH